MSLRGPFRGYWGRAHLFSLLFVLMLPAVFHGVLWGWSFAGLISSLGSAAVAFLLLYRRSFIVQGVVLLVWSVLQSSSLELVLAVGRMPNLRDFIYLVDPTMIRQSLQGNGLAWPGYLVAMLLASFGVAVLRWRAGQPSRSSSLRNICLLFIALAFSLHPFARRLNLEADLWTQYAVFHKLFRESVAQINKPDEANVLAWAHREAESIARLDLDGRRLVGQGKARNVLLVILEGISGAYVDQIRKAAGYQLDQHPMPHLSALAKEYGAMHTPDFVAHNHQTIRGLYSILCGNFPKLDGSTPKATELLAVQGRQESCLPAQLARHGFNTNFLQAADLAFMSKDKVMPHIGFMMTSGRESIVGDPENEIAWGWDDQAFFVGALDAIKGLEKQGGPWFLTLLTVGTHQPYGAPKSYLERYPTEMLAATAYLDDALATFLPKLKAMGVLDNTLVIITSDESHGHDQLRLASAWGLNLIFAPERESLPAFKGGVYGLIDITASVLDYFDFPVIEQEGLAGRSLFRDYDEGREMLSYTNGIFRHLNSHGNLVECDFEHLCREYRQEFRFMVPHAVEIRRYSGVEAQQEASLAEVLNHSISLPDGEQDYLFADGDRRQLKVLVQNDWIDNLIGAQYLSFSPGTRTTVTIRIRAVTTDTKGALLRLALKEFDKESSIKPPELPVLQQGEVGDVSFDIDNPTGRRGFSFHLLGEGQGEIEIDEFRVVTRKVADL